MATILVLHGPNLNLLGEREPEIYGNTTLADINRCLEQLARPRHHQLLHMQSNAEFELVERVQGRVQVRVTGPAMRRCRPSRQRPRRPWPQP